MWNTTKISGFMTTTLPNLSYSPETLCDSDFT